MKDKVLVVCLALLMFVVLGGFSPVIAGPAYTVVSTTKPPVIDGKLDDDVWGTTTFYAPI